MRTWTARLLLLASCAALSLALLVPTGRARADEKVAKPAAAGAGDAPVDKQALITEGKKLLAEGDKLADAGNINDAMLKYNAAYTKLLVPMRGLAFKHDVKAELIPRDQLKKTLVEKIDEDVKPEEIKAEEASLKAFGLIPVDMDLKAVMIQMLTEEIAGFYDPKTKAMHLIKEADAPKPDGDKPAKEPGLLDKLFGGGKDKKWDKDENKGVIAHEMTHALADQHYDLEKLTKSAGDDSDRSLALTALIEGEAMLTMIGATQEDWDGENTANIPAGQLRLMMNLMGPMMTMGAGPSLKEAPEVIRESLIFPYIKGMIFCATVTNKDGWAGLDKAYASPPLSSEQILHPEKYAGKPEELDAPQAVELGELPAPAGWKELGRNVVGELGLRVMLKEKAAAGWDGDGYAVFEGPEGRLGLVWVTTWDTEKDATEFFDAVGKHQQRHIKDGGDPIGGGQRDPDLLKRQQNGRQYVARRKGKDVVVIEGFDGKQTSDMAQAAGNAKKSEKTAAKAETKTTDKVREGGDVKK